jgi:hypothetical protein
VKLNLAQYKYHDDFSLGGKFLSDMGGTIINTDTKKKENQLPDIEHSTDKDSVNNGERYIQSRYQPRTIDNISVIFKDDTDMALVRAWLGKNEQQVFYWRDDPEHKEIDVIYNKSIDLGAYYGKQDYVGDIDNISFIAYDPLWRIQNEYERKITSPIIGQEYFIKSNGNVESSPIIRVKVPSTQTTIKLLWNDLNITLTNVLSEIYIDSENGEVYEYLKGEKDYQMVKYRSNNDDNYNMPTILPFVKNTFKIIQGNISEIGITLNSRIL